MATSADTYNTIGLVIAAVLGLLIVGGAYWSYTVEKLLLIAVISGLMMIYALQNIVLLSVIRKTLQPWVYKVYMGTSVFFAVMGAILMTTFIFIGLQRIRRSAVVPAYAYAAPVAAAATTTSTFGSIFGPPASAPAPAPTPDAPTPVVPTPTPTPVVPIPSAARPASTTKYELSPAIKSYFSSAKTPSAPVPSADAPPLPVSATPVSVGPAAPSRSYSAVFSESPFSSPKAPETALIKPAPVAPAQGGRRRVRLQKGRKTR